MYSFHQIEQLIEREVFKIPLPPNFGEGPEWKVKKGFRGRPHKGGFHKGKKEGRPSKNYRGRPHKG
jgi:hypothetical protein